MLLALVLSLPTRAGLPLPEAQTIVQIEAQRLPPLALAEFVEDDDPAVRARAARALGRLRTAGAIAPLTRLMSDEVVEVRLEAAFALGQTPDSERVVLGLLEEERDPQVRATLCGALGKQGAQEAAKVLVELVFDDPRVFRRARVSEEASKALGRIAQREAAELSAEHVDALLAQLSRGDVYATRGAAFALYRMRVTDISNGQLALWQQAAHSHRDGAVRAWLIRGMTTWEDRRKDIRGFLDAHGQEAHTGARIAIARLAVAAEWEPVVDLLADPDHSVRMQAIRAVGELADLDRKVLLGHLLEEGAPDEKAAAIQVLAAADLMDGASWWLSGDHPPQVRAAALEAIEDTDQLTKLALTAEHARVRTAAAMRLVELDPDRDVVLALLDAADPVIAAIASDWFRENPTSSAEAALLKAAAESDDPDLVAEATRALAALYAARKARPGSAARDLADRLGGHGHGPVRAAADELREALRLSPEQPSPHTFVSVDLDEALTIASARVHTSRGEVVIALFPEEAPITVTSFAHLAESGFYDGRSVHRAVPDFVVQDGCPRGDGWGGPGYAIPDEINPIPYREGTVGMALSGPDTGGSQWFVTLSPQPHLDGTYTVFGEVVHGMHTIRALRVGDVIERVQIERVGLEGNAVASSTETGDEAQPE